MSQASFLALAISDIFGCESTLTFGVLLASSGFYFKRTEITEGETALQFQGSTV